MSVKDQLDSIYFQYAQQAQQVRENAGMFDGVLGLGNDPRNNPCHEAFYQQVKSWVADFLACEPGPEEAFQATQYILMSADRYRNEEAYWFCYAAQGLTQPLIDLVPPEQCRQLAEEYERCYPRRDRMPVQQKICRKLKKRAKMG